MKQGCLIIAPQLIADPLVFDTLADEFNIIRQLEVDKDTHILIVAHDQLNEVSEGDFLPFYDVVFENLPEGLKLKEISAPFIHPNFCIKCQSKKETNTDTENREDKKIILLS